MDILITCYRLDLTGSSTYTLTLATELKNRGHSVTVFSPFPEVIADEMRKRKISVFKNLRDIASRQFSIIIAQHNILAAMVRTVLPEVPMIFICHGKILPQAYLEQPLPIDIDVRKYIAVSDRIRDHLIVNHQIPPHCVETVANFVDTQKFLPRSEIRQVPGVVLLLSNRCTRQMDKTVKRACRKLNLRLMVIGGNRQVSNVQDYINKADIVISLGRGILEAMACGRAAIVYGYLGGDGMITQDNIDLLKKGNFCGRVFRKNYNVKDLTREIRKYHPSMGEINRAIVLREFSVSMAADKITDICNEVLNTFHPKPISRGKIDRYLSQKEYIFPFVREHVQYSGSATSLIRYRIIDRILTPHTKIKHFAGIILGRIRKILRIPAAWMRVFLWLFFSPRPIRRLKNAWTVFRAEGLRACYLGSIERFSDTCRTYRYGHNELTPFQSQHLFSRQTGKPVISILAVVHPATSVRWMTKCIQSVCRQHYQNWELILLGEHNEKTQEVCTFLKSASQKDKRIRLYPSSSMTPGSQLNEGLKVAGGEFICVLGPHDELAPDALTWFVWASCSHSDARWFYSDEDAISALTGRHYEPNFKPDFSAEYLLSGMFTGNMSVYCAKDISQIQGFSERPDLDIFHDVALRLSEIVPAAQIIHIPRILYHRRYDLFWNRRNRCLNSESAESGRRAVREALNRRNLKGNVTSDARYPKLFQLTLEPAEFPKVSILIPTRNGLDLLKTCIRSIRSHTQYPDYEIIVIDNMSDDPALLQYLCQEQSENNLQVVRYEKPFNHSEMNNTAVHEVRTDWIVLMNNDIEILSDRWLEQLVATAQMDESIASVGGLLLYPNGNVQHGGILLGIRGIAGHAHKYMNAEDSGYFGRLHALQEYSGVTAALSLIRKSAFTQIDGFNSVRYPTSFNDVDLCIRLKQNGFRCIYNPMVCAIHHELKSRPITKDEMVFRQRLAQDHNRILNNDPFYNPNLSLSNEQFRGFREFPVEYQIQELSTFIQQF
jgi:GT2 family glycosyltransferase/glycosyltransferase involved in cell wall biosynthesis